MWQLRISFSCSSTCNSITYFFLIHHIVVLRSLKYKATKERASLMVERNDFLKTIHFFHSFNFSKLYHYQFKFYTSPGEAKYNNKRDWFKVSTKMQDNQLHLFNLKIQMKKAANLTRRNSCLGNESPTLEENFKGAWRRIESKLEETNLLHDLGWAQWNFISK